jgi:hypothetical protein
MFGLRSILLSLTLILAASLLGCGSSFVPASPSASPGNLAGNWLLGGSIPTGLDSTANVTAFLNVTGSQVDGYLFLSQLPCESSPGINFSVPLTGTVAADGTFALTTQYYPNNAQSATLKGTVPSTAGGPWTGTYSYTYVRSSCSVPVTTFDATAIAPVTGAYSGTAVLYDASQPLPPGTSVPITLSLQQGNYTPYPTYDTGYVQMSGTISIANSPCLTSGTMYSNSTVTSDLIGTTVSMYFLMNDGSTVAIVGEINNQNSSVLTVDSFTPGGNLSAAGTCEQLLSSPPTPPYTITLTR